MNNFILTAAAIGLLSLTACDKPTVVNVPADHVAPAPSETVIVPVPVPGPAGAPGPAGRPGSDGETTNNTTVIVPPADKPAE